MYELHDFGRSASAWRVRIALAFKNISHEKITVDITAGDQHEAQYRAANPQGLIPLYGDEETLVSQSLAIIEYLEERYPEPSLLPQTREARARTRQLAHIICSDVHPLNTHRVHNYLRNSLGLDTPGRRRWFEYWLFEGLDALELWLASDNLGHRYCVGDSITLADVCLVPQLELARRNEIDIDDFPRLLEIEANCLSHDAFSSTRPD